MRLFKSKYEKELDDIIQSLVMNMSNNYKDNAQANYRDLKNLLEGYANEGKIKGKRLEYYNDKIKEFESELKGYTHKDQTPYWT